MPNKKKPSSTPSKKAKTAADKPPAKKQTAAKKTTPAPKGKGSSAAASSSSKPVAPIASVARVRSPRPHAFTLEDVEEFLQARKSRPEQERPIGGIAAPQAVARPIAPQPVEEEDPLPPAEKQSHAPASLEDILGFNPQEKEKSEEKLLSEIPKKFHKHYKDLQKLRAQVLESLEFHTEETLNRSAKEDSGDLSGYGQHQADAGTDNYDRDYALSLVSDGQELLFEIEEAIKRIHNGTYGICEVTGKVINKERLNAVPFARYSLEGQIEFEKTQRRQSQRGGIFDSALEESPTFGGDDDSED